MLKITKATLLDCQSAIILVQPEQVKEDQFSGEDMVQLHTTPVFSSRL